MIIQIRGTSGSGKSTVMRQVIKQLGDPPGTFYIEGRKKPLYYTYFNRLTILGHYESPCGGCDTIGSAKAVYDLIQRLNPKTKIVLCEGLLLSEDVKWTMQLPDPRVFFLATPIEQCIEWIKKRREEVGNDKPLNESNTRNRVAVIERAYNKLRQQGVYCRRCTVASASSLVLDQIRSVIHV